MKCPKCSLENVYVVDTRQTFNNQIIRRRKCADCGIRFTTYEYIVDSKSVLGGNQDGKENVTVG